MDKMNKNIKAYMDNRNGVPVKPPRQQKTQQKANTFKVNKP